MFFQAPVLILLNDFMNRNFPPFYDISWSALAFQALWFSILKIVLET